MTRPLRILFVASEAMPWIKTGGLADAVSGLAGALAALGHEVRLLLPAYADMSEPPPAEATAVLQRGPVLDSGLALWFCHLPGLSDRPGNPYHDARGEDWPDNWHRFGSFCQLAAAAAADRVDWRWRPDVVHCHDWQTALVPVQLLLQRSGAASVFTIHNLAYIGLYPATALAGLGLPGWLFHPQALEFHGQLALIKGGLVFADALTTVSPGYAREICQPEHGHGLDGLLRERRAALHGILNGIDTAAWDSAADPALAARYSARRLTGKARCKAALQQELGLAGDAQAPLLGVVSRLVPQKGIDLVLAILPQLLARGCQLAVLGSGQAALQAELERAAAAYPGRIGLRLGYDETLAHRIEAGADLFLMPSRFEPCGLNQMYSQRYGTPPVVHATGGLRDSVVDADETALADGRAGGFRFTPATPEALLAAVERALALRQDARAWRALQRAAMAQDFGWEARAKDYLGLYRQVLAQRSRLFDLGQ